MSGGPEHRRGLLTAPFFLRIMRHYRLTHSRAFRKAKNGLLFTPAGISSFKTTISSTGIAEAYEQATLFQEQHPGWSVAVDEISESACRSQNFWSEQFAEFMAIPEYEK